MLSSIRSYFQPVQVKPSVSDLGVDPAQQDELGFSPIDYAVFESQTQKLHQLFPQPGKSQLAINRPQHSIKLQKIIDQSAIQSFEKIIGKIGEADLDYPQSHNSILLEKFLNSDFKTNGTLKYSGIAPIHLLALFAKPDVLKQVIAKHPEWLELKDSRGNTPLHYAALNKDEHSFVLLAKAGGNIFVSNSENVRAIGEFIHQIKSRDPLQWNNADLFVFISSWLPIALDFVQNNISNDEMLTTLKEQLPTISLIASFVHLSTILSSIQSKSEQALFVIVLLATSWIPVIQLPYKAYVTYTLAQRALESLKQGYTHFNRRPFTASIMGFVKTANALEYGKGLFDNCAAIFYKVKAGFDVFGYIRDTAQKWEEFKGSVNTTCGEKAFQRFSEEPALFSNTTVFPADKYPFVIDPETGKRVFEMEKDMKCALDQFETTFASTLNSDIRLQNFYDRVINPFMTSYAGDCLEHAKTFEEQKGGGPRLAAEQRVAYATTVFQTLLQNYITDLRGDAGGQGSEAECLQYYQRPDGFEGLKLLERLRVVPNPKEVIPGQKAPCLNVALDAFGMSDLCAKNGSKPLYKQIYQQISLVTHPDKSSEEDAVELSRKARDVYEALGSAFKEKC